MDLLIVRDPDPARREETLRAATSLVVLQGTSPVVHAIEGFSVAAWMRPHVPRTIAAGEDGLFIAIGDLEARERNGLPDCGWLDGADDYPDGYFVALRIRNGALQLAVDKLGLMPLWYWHDGERLIATTHLGLLRTLAATPIAPDLRGLLSILVFGHPVGDATLWSPLKRLSPGRLLHLSPDGRLTLRDGFEIPQGETHPGLLPELMEEVDACLSQGLRRALPEGAHCWIALSGGRDSRLLAGHAKAAGYDVRALTFGQKGEADLYCAQQVARTLGIPQVVEPLSEQASVPHLEDFVRATQASTGNPGADQRQLGDRLLGHADRIVTGYLLDPVLGGSHMAWSTDLSTGQRGFPVLLRRLNRWGMPLDMLRGVLRSDGRDQLEELLAACEETYLACGASDPQRVWHYDLRHRQRHYIGIIPKAFCDSAWPVIPAADRRLLALCASVQPALLANRRLQDEVLRQRWPGLARLPVDRATGDITPLTPSLRWELSTAIRKRLPWPRRHVAGELYYARLLSVNSAGWKALRAQARATGVDAWPDAFDRDRLRALLPDAQQVLRGEHAILTWEWVKPLTAVTVSLADAQR